MVPRPANPEIKEKLFVVGQALVLRQGFAATSIDQICKGAGVTKGSFFHYFASKQDLGEELLHRYGSERMGFMMTGPDRDIADPRERLFGYLQKMLDVSGDPQWLEGCLMGNLGQEVSRSNPAMREIVAMGMKVWSEFVEADLRAAKRMYAPRAGWKPTEVARHLIAVFQGGLLLVRITGDDRALRTSIEHYMSYVASLLGTEMPRATPGKTRKRTD